MRKAFLILLSLLILLPLFSLFFWVFTERWPWPNILPKDFSERALKSPAPGSLGMYFSRASFSRFWPPFSQSSSRF